MKKHILLLMICFFSFAHIQAQVSSYQTQILTTGDGLSGNTIYNVFQDQQGIVWIATTSGLNKYDGYEIENFFNVPSDTTSISNDFVYKVFEDHKKRLWIGTRHGLNRYIREKNAFERYFSRDTVNTLSNNLVNEIIQGDNGKLWLGTYDGIDLFDPATNTFRNYKPYKRSTNKNWTLKILKDANGNLWLGTFSGGLYFFNTKTSNFTLFEPDNDNPTSIDGNMVRDLVEDQYGNIWVATLDGLNIFNKTTLAFTQEKNTPTLFENISDNRILSLLETEKKDIWIGTLAGGLNIFNRNNNTITHIFEKESDNEGLSRNSITSIYSDQTNNIWLGTEGGGLTYYYKKPDFQSHNSDNELINKHIHAIKSDMNNNLWLGTEGGLIFFDRKNNNFQNYIYQIPELNQIRLQATAIEIVSENTLWVGSNQGLYKFNINEQKFIKIKDVPKCFVFSIIRQNSNIWIGTTQEGLFKYNMQNSTFTNYREKIKSGNFLYSNEIATMYLKGDSILWIGCRGSLDKYLINQERFIHHPFRYNTPDGITDEHIRSITSDKKGNIWVATLKGLNKFRPSTGTWQHFFKDDGLPSNNIMGLLTDPSNRLWISTEHGLARFDQKTEQFISFYKEDGLQGNHFHSRACHKTNANELIFGGTNGFTIFDPDEIEISSELDTIIIKKFTILSKEASRETPVYDFNNLQLKHNQSSFSITFSAINFHSSEKIKYACKLEHEENSWRKLNFQRSVNYLRLNPGHYTFHVKAYDINYPDNSVTTKIHFDILPPFWQTWGFRAFVIVALLLSVFSIYWIRVRRLKRKQILLEAMVKARTEEIYNQKEELAVQADALKQLNATKDRFFSIIAHDLRNPFQNIMDTASYLKNDFNKIPKAKTIDMVASLEKTAENTYNLLENLLHWARSQTNKIQVNFETFNFTLLVENCIQLSKINAEKKSIRFQKDIDDKFYVQSDKNILTTIIRNLISNAIKFSYPGSVIKISASRTGENSMIKIEDKGIGMDEDTLNKLFRIDQHLTGKGTSGEKGTGLGLILAKELTEKINGGLSVRSKVGAGTTFYIELPPESAAENWHKPEKSKGETEKYLVTDLEGNKTEEGKFSLLIIDDDKTVRENLTRELVNYQVKSADNGKDGLIKTINYMPDLVVCDVMMPVMDGIEFCQKLKEDDRTSHIPVILLTANTEEETKIKGIESGAEDFITKPFKPEILKKRIENIIAARHRLKKKFQQQTDVIPKDISLNNYEEQFLQKVLNSIDKNIDNPDFTVNELGKDIGISRSVLYVKIKAITGQTANDFFKSIKLKKAAKILTNSSLSIQEVALLVGYKNYSHFSRSFARQFGQSPMQYRKMKK